ncbi:class I SAM-dependent methyltransferase [Rhodoferax sp. UBA5149]|uniref:class I SAM-dependent methyltransferase n=1 Tax=Rhodoferax sp. UBA5149 TaxID=1947379 RepID=UPI0025D5DF15|nr:class I SAM-dependent methyltransferase [Rhodoferax sp. UBA5149]
MERNVDSSVTWGVFEQREEHRRSLFSNVWSQLVPKVFKDVPKYYRPGNIVASLGLWELWVWQFVRTIALRPHYQVLDVCAGTNDVGVRLLKKEPGISVTAIDRSAEMQEEGQCRAKKNGLHIASIIHDVHVLPFPDNSFDVITLQAASRHLQLDKVLPEILRVLKPGGFFYHCDMLKPTNPIVEWFYLRFLRVSVFLTSLIFGSTEASRGCGGYFSDAIHHFYTPEELSGVLKLIGFANVSCKKSIWGGMVGFHAAQKAPA